MDNIVETRKAINFDEGSRELELIYTKMTGKNSKSAWEDIGRELKKLGFVKDQYSGYVSSEPLTFPQAVTCIKKLNNKLRWLKYCSLEFKLTEVTERFFSLNSFFAKSAKANKNKGRTLPLTFRCFFSKISKLKEDVHISPRSVGDFGNIF